MRTKELFEEIRKKANVVGYSLKPQPRIRSGKTLPELCFRVYVSRKLPERELRATDVIPREIDGVPVDVVEVGEIRALGYTIKEGKPEKTKRFRPVIFGVSIGHIQITAGTNGFLFTDKKGNQYFGSNAHVFCYSEDTEVLTKDGWKSFKELSYNDEVATLNEKTGELEYQKPTRIISFYYKGDMIHYKERYVDLLVTPEHHFFLLKGRRKEPVHTSGEDLVKKLGRTPNPRLYFKKDFKWNGSELKSVVIPPAKVSVKNQYGFCGERDYAKNVAEFPAEPFLRLLGWYLTEGSISRVGPGKSEYMISIRNTDPENLKEIVETVKALGLKPYVDEGSVRFYSKQLFEYFRQFGYDHERFIPTEFKNLKREQLEILFESLIKGDGHKYRNRNGYVFVSSSKRLAEDVAEIAMKLGWAVKFSIKKGSGFNPSGTYYFVHIHKPRLHRVLKSNLSIVHYEGFVYDVTVPNHIIMVRRNGIPVWCGNCPDPSKEPDKILVKDIVQPGPYDGGTLADKVAEYVWHRRIVPVGGGSGCPVARVWAGIYNSLAKAFGARTRLKPVIEEPNHIDFAVASPTAEYLIKFPDFELADHRFVGLGFAGSDVTSLVCKARYIADEGYYPDGVDTVEVREGDVVMKTGRTSCFTKAKVIDTSAAIEVGYGSFTAWFEDVILTEKLLEPGDSGSSVWVEQKG